MTVKQPQHSVGNVIGRIPVIEVSPVVEGGAYPAKATLGELIPFRARVFREGHDAVNASVMLTSPSGVTSRHDMAVAEPAGFDWRETWVRLDEEGDWTFRIEGWDDPWATWQHDAGIKFTAGMDISLMCTEGRLLIEEALGAAKAADDDHAIDVLSGAVTALTDSAPADELVDLTRQVALDRAMRLHGPRRLVTPSPTYPIFVDRVKALYSSWYEFFPRSQNPTWDDEAQCWRSGTFDGCHDRLEAAAAMGFDVIYLPPIHPVGTAFRKGPNNTLTPGPNDVGSPWAIGAPEGGHDAIHPDLGDWDSFDRFVAKARSLGLEIALDLALQASPDHPWVTDHPEWFSERADGTIAYAENPPKKYQDIYPINFDRDPDGIYAEVERVVRLWMSHGVRIFRVDNPHTKPLDFWAWLLGRIRQTDPDVLFLAEAFTRPAMLQGLGKIGFHQSYTYFTWRNEKIELSDYVTELSTVTDSIVRPNFFVNTPDILTGYLVQGGPPAFAIRAVLAATLSPTWGMYSGYELFENTPVRPGSEEYLDSEKYQIVPRDWNAEPNLCELVTTLNRLRREHPALQQLRQTTFHESGHPDIIVYSRTDGDDHVIVVCTMNPSDIVESEITLDLSAFGARAGDVLTVHDELSGETWTWGSRNYVKLSPERVAHVLRIDQVAGR